MKRRLISFAVIALFTSGIATASRIEQDFSLDVLFDNTSIAGSFLQFQSSWGTLNWIQMELDPVSVVLTATWNNTNTGSALMKTYSKQTQVTISDSKSELMDKVGPLNSPMVTRTIGGTTSPCVAPCVLPGTYQNPFNLSTTTAITQWTAAGVRVSGSGASTIDASLFKGTSTLSLNFVSANAGFYVSAPTGAGFTGEGEKARITGTLIYDYTPTPPSTIPEPVTLALLGSGLVAMGWLGRKRIKR